MSDKTPGPDAGRSVALTYMPQLDGLRAVACFAVVYSHFVSAEIHGVFDALPWGAMGVQFFFVLSGFLVTIILLDNRDLIDQGTQTLGHTLRAFHARRVLRIIPLYYSVLLVLFILNYGIIRESIGWHVLFIMNFWRSITGINFLNHLWAVAVEQQFYMVWPLVVLAVPRKKLVPLILVLMALAPAYRIWAWLAQTPFVTLNTIPVASFDTLGLGALLAILQRQPTAYPTIRYLLFRVFPWISVAGLTVMSIGRQAGVLDAFIQGAFVGTLLVPVYAVIVRGGVRGFGGPAGAFLQAGPIRYLGIISYGIYVLHPLIKDAWVYAHQTWAVPYAQNIGLRFVVLVILSIAAASATWFAMEKPMNDLKRHFPYRPRTEPSSARPNGTGPLDGTPDLGK